MQFFGSLFGWVGERFADDHVSHYVLNTAVTVRLLDDPASAPVRPNYVVDDVGAAVAAIEALGGQRHGIRRDLPTAAAGPLPRTASRCRWSCSGHPVGDHPESDAPVSGDVAFVFVREDKDAAARFYGAVLGWELRWRIPTASTSTPSSTSACSTRTRPSAPITPRR